MHKPIIQTHDLTFAYHDGKPVLTSIDLTIMHDESVGLIGPNGAGKSTLLMHFNGILRGSGTVLVNDIPVEKATLKKVRRLVGWVAQDSNDQLFMPTLFDDVAFGPLNMGLPEDEVRRRVDQTLRLVGLDKMADRPPHHLSGGERKAAAIATVLSMRPEIMLLDEPTNNLDHAGRRALIDFLIDLQTTKVVASHDLEMILDLCPRVILLDGGRVIADGPSDKILADEKLLSAHRLEPPLSALLKKERDARIARESAPSDSLSSPETP